MMDKESNVLVIALAIVGVILLFAFKLVAIGQMNDFEQWLEKLSPAYLASSVVLLVVLVAVLAGYVLFLRSEVRNLKDRY